MAIDSSQSTNHIALVRPKVFFSNPQTQETNPYQDAEKPVSDDAIYQKALEEFYGFHHMLVENGIIVTVLPGAERCPDHIFPCIDRAISDTAADPVACDACSSPANTNMFRDAP